MADTSTTAPTSTATQDPNAPGAGGTIFTTPSGAQVTDRGTLVRTAPSTISNVAGVNHGPDAQARGAAALGVTDGTTTRQVGTPRPTPSDTTPTTPSLSPMPDTTGNLPNSTASSSTGSSSSTSNPGGASGTQTTGSDGSSGPLSYEDFVAQTPTLSDTELEKINESYAGDLTTEMNSVNGAFDQAVSKQQTVNNFNNSRVAALTANNGEAGSGMGNTQRTQTATKGQDTIDKTPKPPAYI